MSLDVAIGECLGLVGESGSGKTVTAQSIFRLPSAATVQGQILFDGEDLLTKTEAEMRRLRGSDIAMVLQDPMTALNPVFRIGKQVSAPVRRHLKIRGTALRQRVVESLAQVMIPHPKERLRSYPHEFSGGMRQRVVGAIALSGDPRLLVADEPTTSLDVTVQAAYLDLLRKIRAERNLAVLFVTHDFGIVSDICDRVAVMYAGRIMETAPTNRILNYPRHPYTKALLRSVPSLVEPEQRLLSIPGAPPSVYAPPSGCRFHPRCWLYEAKGRPERCRTEVPTLTRATASTSPAAPTAADAKVACHFSSEAEVKEPSDPIPVAPSSKEPTPGHKKP